MKRRFVPIFSQANNKSECWKMENVLQICVDRRRFWTVFSCWLMPEKLDSKYFAFLSPKYYQLVYQLTVFTSFSLSWDPHEIVGYIKEITFT